MNEGCLAVRLLGYQTRAAEVSSRVGMLWLCLQPLLTEDRVNVLELRSSCL